MITIASCGPLCCRHPVDRAVHRAHRRAGRHPHGRALGLRRRQLPLHQHVLLRQVSTHQDISILLIQSLAHV